MATMRCLVVVVVAAMVFLVVGAGAQDCTSAYNYLTTCYSYVSGSEAAPSAQCCNGISYLNTNDVDCLCQIVNQFNSSNTPGVNATKAFELPRLCNVVVDSAKCPAVALAPGAAVAPAPPLLAPPAGDGPTSSPSTSAAAPRVISFTTRALGAVFVVTHFVWNALAAT